MSSHGWGVRTGRLLVASGLIGSLLAAGPVRADDGRIRRHLEPFSNLEAMSEFVGRRPERCVWSSWTKEICSWVLKKDDGEAWQTVADLLHTRRRIGLVCEFAVKGDAGGNWCFVRPRETNRRRWEATTRPEMERVAGLARRALAAARTLPEMSRLMGIGPDACSPSDWEEESSCVWHADDEVWGHALLAASIEVYSRKKVRLECRFPDDGGPREKEDSCAVSLDR